MAKKGENHEKDTQTYGDFIDRLHGIQCCGLW